MTNPYELADYDMTHTRTERHQAIKLCDANLEEVAGMVDGTVLYNEMGDERAVVWGDEPRERRVALPGDWLITVPYAPADDKWEVAYTHQARDLELLRGAARPAEKGVAQ